MILPELPGKTYGQVAEARRRRPPSPSTRSRPPAAARTRSRTKCRVQMFREESGAAGLSGRDLPTDQTLAAHARVSARAARVQGLGGVPRRRQDGPALRRRRVPRPDQTASPPRLCTSSGQLVAFSLTVTARLMSGTGPLRRRPPGDGGPNEKRSELPGIRTGAACPKSPARKRRPVGPGEPGGRRGPDSESNRGTLAHGRQRLFFFFFFFFFFFIFFRLGLRTWCSRWPRCLASTSGPGEGYGLGPLDPALCRELAAAAIGSPWSRGCARQSPMVTGSRSATAVPAASSRRVGSRPPIRPTGGSASAPGPALPGATRRCLPGVNLTDHRRPAWRN